MAAAKRVLVICGTGVATSTVVVQKIRSFCETDGLNATVGQGAVADLISGRVDADFIVATTPVPISAIHTSWFASAPAVRHASSTIHRRNVRRSSCHSGRARHHATTPTPPAETTSQRAGPNGHRPAGSTAITAATINTEAPVTRCTP